MHEDEDFLATWPTQPASPVDLPKRTRRRAVRADMVPIDSVLSGSDSSSESDTSVQSSAGLQYPASDAGPASHEIASAGPSFNLTVFNGSTSTSSTSSQDASHLPHSPSTVQERPAQTIDIVPEPYCHQCRRQTNRPKMKCRGKKTNIRGAPCKLEYCDHCVQQRYPQLKFDKTNAKFECPKCSGYCNCTQCARQRGEVYKGGPRTAQANSNVQQPDKTQPRAKNVRNLPSAPANPTRYWGTVYHNVTGEKVSAAYAGSDDEDPRVVVPRFTSTKGALPARVHGQHMFVGKVQDSWQVNYRRVKGGIRGRATGRVYIGRRPPIQRPVYVDDDEEGEEDFDRPRSSSPISGAESDLTPLPDTPPHWLEPEEGESLSYGLAPEVTEEVTKKALEALLGSMPPPP
ncbi:hypothetical protein FIBSPDRAFT_550653 [Athelia psychrophila]|uniref:Zinc-finger domain-containing protein n=1 Tax=Athelia psychrophila TaxID=1759441 RepID=A0A166UTN2_9AGAM|nr:hypothetical protein FIBSPDRAFT_550653 [Fibularhizoctonia sp. CBS 109695]